MFDFFNTSKDSFVELGIIKLPEQIDQIATNFNYCCSHTRKREYPNYLSY